MHDADSRFIPAFDHALWGAVSNAPTMARLLRESSDLGTHHSDEDLRGFRPFQEDPPWRMPRSSRDGSAAKLGIWALLGLLAIITIRMLMAQ